MLNVLGWRKKAFDFTDHNEISNSKENIYLFAACRRSINPFRSAITIKEELILFHCLN